MPYFMAHLTYVYTARSGRNVCKDFTTVIAHENKTRNTMRLCNIHCCVNTKVCYIKHSRPTTSPYISGRRKYNPSRKVIRPYSCMCVCVWKTTTFHVFDCRTPCTMFVSFRQRKHIIHFYTSFRVMRHDLCLFCNIYSTPISHH